MNFLKSKYISKFNLLKWEISDVVMEIDDIIPDQFPDFVDKFHIDTPFMCIKNFKHSCIYLKEENLNKFMQNSKFCNNKRNLINLSKLLDYMIDEDCYSQVISKAIPPYICIKQVIICRIDDYDVYIERLIRLNRTDELFQDLMNLQIMKENYNSKIKGEKQ